MSVIMGLMKQCLMILSVAMAAAAMAAQADRTTSREMLSTRINSCQRYINGVKLHCIDEKMRTMVMRRTYGLPTKLCCRTLTEFPYICAAQLFEQPPFSGSVFNHLIKLCIENDRDVEDGGR